MHPDAKFFGIYRSDFQHWCNGIPGRYLDNNEATNPITPEMNLRYSMDPDDKPPGIL